MSWIVFAGAQRQSATKFVLGPPRSHQLQGQHVVVRKELVVAFYDDEFSQPSRANTSPSFFVSNKLDLLNDWVFHDH